MRHSYASTINDCERQEADVSLWKIRNKETGQFSDGGKLPSWTDKAGKLYQREAFAWKHLLAVEDELKRMCLRSGFGGIVRHCEAYLEAAEVVEMGLEELSAEAWIDRVDHSSKALVVQVLERDVPGWGTTPHIKVRRYDWSDGITWDELQQAKDNAGFADRPAIEVFPPKDSVVYEVNMRHLWVVPDGVAWPDLRGR